MTMIPATHAYVGTALCGCTVAVVADMPDLIKDTAQAVYGFILDGLAVTRVAADEVTFQRCPHQLESNSTASEHLYEVHHFVRSYVLATDEEDAEDIMEDALIERVADGSTDVLVRRVSHLPTDVGDTIPWAADGESRTCLEILAEAEISAKQASLTFE